MVDTLARAVRRGPVADAAAVSIELARPASRLILRGSAEVARLAGSAFGCPVPIEACRARHDGGRAALWLGPDEWLLLVKDEPATVGIAATIETAIGAVPHALVDVSHRQVGIGVSGPGAALLLNAGCPLDLALKAFPVDMSTRTVLAKADITLWREAEDRFWIEIGRSFAPYLLAYLKNAEAGLA